MIQMNIGGSNDDDVNISMMMMMMIQFYDNNNNHLYIFSIFRDLRDRGLTRPKVLILVPFRDSVLKIVNIIMDLLIPDGRVRLMILYVLYCSILCTAGSKTLSGVYYFASTSASIRNLCCVNICGSDTSISSSSSITIKIKSLHVFALMLASGPFSE